MKTETPTTPAEVAKFLRRYNEWRRGNDDLEMPNPKQIGEALDIAAEMLEINAFSKKWLDDSE